MFCSDFGRDFVWENASSWTSVDWSYYVGRGRENIIFHFRDRSNKPFITRGREMMAQGGKKDFFPFCSGGFWVAPPELVQYIRSTVGWEEASDGFCINMGSWYNTHSSHYVLYTVQKCKNDLTLTFKGSFTLYDETMWYQPQDKIPTQLIPHPSPFLEHSSDFVLRGPNPLPVLKVIKLSCVWYHMVESRSVNGP